jgi:hypothetical protein
MNYTDFDIKLLKSREAGPSIAVDSMLFTKYSSLEENKIKIQVISRSYYQSANPTVIIAFIVLSC